MSVISIFSITATPSECYSAAFDDNGEQHKLPHHKGGLQTSQSACANNKAAEPREVRSPRRIRRCVTFALALDTLEPCRRLRVCVANKKELAGDLVLKAKQIDLLIQSLPPPEPEEKQVSDYLNPLYPALRSFQAERLQVLENQMAEANEDYVRAVSRASKSHNTVPEDR